MTQTIQMYRSVNGTIHETEQESLKADLHYCLMQSNTINEASATKLVEWLSGSGEAADIINALHQVQP